ncbi:MULTISPECIES: hypothetical protein [Heyndrickxia]
MIDPAVFGDRRGWFIETYNEKTMFSLLTVT